MRSERIPLRALLACAAMFAAVGAIESAHAQEKGSKPPTPRLTPIPSGSNAIPAGPNGGTPATSESAQLGTPVTPANDAERDALKSQSAAARAAARGRGPSTSASGVGCPPTVSAAAASGVAARAPQPRTPVPAATAAMPAAPTASSVMARATQPSDCL